MRVLILGGTRFVGRRVAQMLVAMGAEVTLLSRGQTGDPIAGTRSVIGDRSQPDGLAALGDERFDAVLDLSAYFADWTSAAAEALTGRVAHYVFISSGAVYRPHPSCPGRSRRRSALSRSGAGTAPRRWPRSSSSGKPMPRGTMQSPRFRFPFILGPANFADRESFVLSRLEARRPILLPGGGEAVNQFVYVEDVARALVVALERPDVAGGEAYNCAYGRGITNRGWVELCADVIGAEANLVPIDERSSASRPRRLI